MCPLSGNLNLAPIINFSCYFTFTLILLLNHRMKCHKCCQKEIKAQDLKFPPEKERWEICLFEIRKASWKNHNSMSKIVLLVRPGSRTGWLAWDMHQETGPSYYGRERCRINHCLTIRLGSHSPFQKCISCGQKSLIRPIDYRIERGFYFDHPFYHVTV